MSITTEWEIKNINKYAYLLKEEHLLKEKLSMIHDEMINLTLNMTNEDINEAEALFEKMISEN